MTAESHPDLVAYYQEAQGWDSDRVRSWQRSAVRAWQVAAAAALCAVISGSALLVALPLKRVEPYVIRVDNTTGVVDLVPDLRTPLSLPESVTRYFLSHYVLVCERFNYSTAESDYEECGAFHTARRNQTWYALWSTNNPRSPLNVHKDGSSVSVQIESVSFFKRASGVSDLAQVRYLKLEHMANGGVERVSHWITTIQYGYATPPSDPRMRRWNPLGFKIVEFVAEPEVVHENGYPSAAATIRASQ